MRMPHSDPLVIHAQIATKTVKRVFIDTGSSVDILAWEAFLQLGVSATALKPYSGTLVAFSGDEIPVA